MRMIGLLLALVEWMRLLTLPLGLIVAGLLIGYAAVGQGLHERWVLAVVLGAIALPLAAFGVESVLRRARRRTALREAADGEGEPL
jgi:uncharacterized membrane-anchored protein